MGKATRIERDSTEPAVPTSDEVAREAFLRQLREDLLRSNRSMDAARSFFLIVDAQRPGNPIVYANRAIAAAHGYEAGELIGQSVSLLRFLNWTDAQVDGMHQALREGHDFSTEAWVERRDGTRFLVGIHVVPLRDDAGRVTHTVSIGTDITARVEAELRRAEMQAQLAREMKERERLALELQLAQKLESVGRLAAGVAHEINTPIQYVGDSVHFLKTAFDDVLRVLSRYRESAGAPESDLALHDRLAQARELEAAVDLDFLTAEIPKAFDRAQNGVERVAAIVRAMKEFSHPDATEHSPADLNHALEMTLTVAANEYKYCARVETRFTEIPAVLCNVGELNQVFLNLIVNAAQAIEETGQTQETGRIVVATAIDGTHVIVTISDNGGGIAEEHLDKIYDPFFTTKEVGKGSGQGLAIARSIVVDKHEGSMDVASEVGRGTCFTLRLPVDRPRRDAAS